MRTVLALERQAEQRRQEEAAYLQRQADYQKKCHKCGRTGHIFRYCPEIEELLAAMNDDVSESRAARFAKEVCGRCFEEGHHKRDCMAYAGKSLAAPKGGLGEHTAVVPGFHITSTGVKRTKVTENVQGRSAAGTSAPRNNKATTEGDGTTGKEVKGAQDTEYVRGFPAAGKSSSSKNTKRTAEGSTVAKKVKRNQDAESLQETPAAGTAAPNKAKKAPAPAKGDGPARKKQKKS